MEITNKQKSDVINIIYSMNFGEIKWFKDFLPEERDYIMQIIINQKKNKDFELDTNGSAASPETITKFRKIRTCYP